MRIEKEDGGVIRSRRFSCVRVGHQAPFAFVHAAKAVGEDVEVARNVNDVEIEFTYRSIPVSESAV